MNIMEPSINKTYIGIASTTFKARYSNHEQSFSNYHKRNNTSLSTYYWKLKQKQLTPTIKWKHLLKWSGNRYQDLQLELNHC